MTNKHAEYEIVKTPILSPIIRLFGIRGSWAWAIRKMNKGKIVSRKNTSGVVKYKLSTDGNKRLLCDFSTREEDAAWGDANLYVSDMESTDWRIFKWKQ